eukprot:TRINITY_DN182_c0_g1_i1.p1 TRINITY_DN182_c0_g1~~TRINITY_DN182_c0_g1_i1.p1  ORF type:complete len:300 (+),score=44.09 TRINITY_DN182_c0_g1_i1:89-988(+)
MIRRPPRSTLSSSSAASDVYKRQPSNRVMMSTAAPQGLSSVHVDAHSTPQEAVLEEYVCDYCGRSQVTNANLWQGKARLACFCGGRRRDGMPRVHGSWQPKGRVGQKDFQQTAAAAAKRHAAVMAQARAHEPNPPKIQTWNIHVYHPGQATSGRGRALQYECGFCAYRKVSASASSDGMVRIRCPCGGARADGVSRMHANWSLVPSAIEGAASEAEGAPDISSPEAEPELEDSAPTDGEAAQERGAPAQGKRKADEAVLLEDESPQKAARMASLLADSESSSKASGVQTSEHEEEKQDT